MKKKIFAIVSVSLVLAMLCVLPSFAFLESKKGTVGSYTVMGSLWGADSSGYYANTLVSSSAKGQIAYIYAKIWMKTTVGDPQEATHFSENSNTTDCDSLPGVKPAGYPVYARGWSYVRLRDGESFWGNENKDTYRYSDYTVEYVFP